MLRNQIVQNEVQFVSYTGSYPNLCSGILTLSVHGEQYVFGHSYQAKHEDVIHRPFWSSGGSCGFTDNYSNAYTSQGAWVIDVSDLPSELQQYAAEIDELFNENVPFGCCGGCL